MQGFLKGGKMNNQAKALTPLLIVLILISLGLAGGGFYLLQKERVKNLALQRELQEAEVKYKKAEAELDVTKRRLPELETQLSEAKSKFETLNSELQQEKTTHQESLAKLEQLQSELEQQSGTKSDLEKKLTQAQEDTEKLIVRLQELNSQKSTLEARIKELEGQAKAEPSSSQGVELGKIVVAPESSGQPAQQKEAPLSGLEGKILVVNKEYNFVVSNLGSKDGVKVGDIFSVFHKNNPLGDVKVEKVHESMSAAGFVTENIKDKVNEGDKVVLKTQ